MAAGGCSEDVVEAGPGASTGDFVDVATTELPSTVPATTPSTAPPATATPGGPGYAVGDCVTWDPAEAASTQATVPCQDQHYVEITAVLDLLGDFPANAATPSS